MMPGRYLQRQGRSHLCGPGSSSNSSSSQLEPGCLDLQPPGQLQEQQQLTAGRQHTGKSKGVTLHSASGSVQVLTGCQLPGQQTLAMLQRGQHQQLQQQRLLLKQSLTMPVLQLMATMASCHPLRMQTGALTGEGLARLLLHMQRSSSRC